MGRRICSNLRRISRFQQSRAGSHASTTFSSVRAITDNPSVWWSFRRSSTTAGCAAADPRLWQVSRDDSDKGQLLTFVQRAHLHKEVLESACVRRAEAGSAPHCLLSLSNCHCPPRHLSSTASTQRVSLLCGIERRVLRSTHTVSRHSSASSTHTSALLNLALCCDTRRVLIP